MGKRNQQRRAAKRRAEAKRAAQPRRERSDGRSDGRCPSVRELLASASMLALARAEGPLGVVVADIVALYERDRVSASTEIVAAVRRGVAACWDRGWQPADLAHVAKRKLTSAGALVGAAAIGVEASSYRSHPRRDPGWIAQVDAVAPGPVPAADADVFDRWARATGGVAQAVAGAAEILGLLGCLRPLPRLVDPPSAWDAGPARSAARVGDPKMAARVRALLAKAESTEFDEEAEAFTAKAQQLIAEHAIDQALLDQEEGGGAVAGRRIHLDDPYLRAKSVLLSAVASANRCRTVTDDGLGFSTVFGYASELDAVELLFSSLLTQATAAMVVASRRAGSGRVRSFRQAFLIAYADRIGQRLRMAAEGAVAEATAVHGEVLLPVLAARDEKVEAALGAAYGRLRAQRISVSNGAGYAAGRAAADLADLGPAARLKAG